MSCMGYEALSYALIADCMRYYPSVLLEKLWRTISLKTGHVLPLVWDRTENLRNMKQEERISHEVRFQIFNFFDVQNLIYISGFLHAYRMSRWAKLSQRHLVACGKGSVMFVTGWIRFVWAWEADKCTHVPPTLLYCTLLLSKCVFSIHRSIEFHSSASFQFNEQWFGSSGKCPSSSCSCHFLLLFKHT
jgi:hypothetical protein